MADFSIASLASGCAYSGFPSTTQHVTRNRHGTFFSIITAQDNVNYAAQTLKVFWLKPDNSLIELPAYDGNPRISASQAAALESFYDTGEVYAVWSNYITGGVFVERWADVSLSTIPQRSVIGGDGTANGKYTTFADEGDRSLYFIGTSGYFFQITQDGNLAYRQQLLSVATAPSYFALSQDEDGRLYLVWNCANTVDGLVNHYALQCLMSMNPHEPPPNGSVWFSGRWGVGAQVFPPIVADNAGPSVPAITGAQARDTHTLLLGVQMTDKGLLQVLYSTAPAAGERMFYYDNLKNCTLGLTGLFWSDAGAIQSPSTISKRPLRCKAVMPRAASGGIFERDSGLYVVTHDNALNLVALHSGDNGATWREFAKTPVPVGGGAQMLHYVSGYRGWDDDGDIVGIVQSVACTPNQWATAGAIPTFAATVYRWSLDLT